MLFLIASTSRAGPGTANSSHAYGQCVSNPTTRCVGASSDRKHRSSTFAAISAPKPPVEQASCVTTKRPVLATEAVTVSTSLEQKQRTQDGRGASVSMWMPHTKCWQQRDAAREIGWGGERERTMERFVCVLPHQGMIVCKSMISQLTPSSFSTRSAASSIRATCVPQPTRVMSSPLRFTFLWSQVAEQASCQRRQFRYNAAQHAFKSIGRCECNSLNTRQRQRRQAQWTHACPIGNS